MYDTILVATDGSETASRAADHATDIASAFEADLHAVYVVDTKRYGRETLSEPGGVLEDLEERGRGILDELVARADVDVTTTVRNGRPEEEISAYADTIDADLVVIGNRGLGAGPGGEIGSVAERIVRNGGRPVLTA